MPHDPAPPKERLALRRFEIVCHLQAQRQTGLPLCDCLRAAASRPWPAEDGAYYAYRTLEVPLELRALKVELRFDPQSLARIEVWHRGRMHGLARLADLQHNSQTHRGTNYAR